MVQTAELWEQARLARRIHTEVLPRVAQAVGHWWQRALVIPDQPLRVQALRSLQLKRFHCAGGSVYAAGAGRDSERLISVICSLQILVDYLDNLADRTGHQSLANLQQLHLAVTDALTPGQPPRPYYQYHPCGNDGGYLESLVRACQSQLTRLPGYGDGVADACIMLGAAYARLQVLKHLPLAVREPELKRWLARLHRYYPGYRWWELAAACGSTLGIFALFRAAAGGPRPAGLQELVNAYFPAIGSLHILLDYYIDQTEDRAGGDLNFVSYYSEAQEAARRLEAIHDEAAGRAQQLPLAALHRLVVAGLPGLYLSDPKVAQQGLQQPAHRLVRRAGPMALASFLYWRLHPPGR